MFELEPLGDEVTGIRTATPGPDGKPILWVYCYQIGNVLFDAGCANARDEFAAYLKTTQISDVYITHAHEDHCGCVDVLAKDADIHAWGSSMSLLRNPPELGEFFKYVWGQPSPIDDVSETPRMFEVGDFHFEVVELPGHFEDMIGFYESNRKWFISADAIPLPSKKYIAMPEENIPLMIATMERIRCLDIEVLFDSHKGAVHAPDEHIKVRIDYLKETHELVRELHVRGLDVKEIMNELNFKSPWYIEMTQDRFAIEFFIESLINDSVE